MIGQQSSMMQQQNTPSLQQNVPGSQQSMVSRQSIMVSQQSNQATQQNPMMAQQIRPGHTLVQGQQIINRPQMPGMLHGAPHQVPGAPHQVVRIQGSQQFTVQGGQVRLQGGVDQQGQPHPAILQQHEQLRLQQQQQQMHMQQQHQQQQLQQQQQQQQLLQQQQQQHPQTSQGQAIIQQQTPGVPQPLIQQQSQLQGQPVGPPQGQVPGPQGPAQQWNQEGQFHGQPQQQQWSAQQQMMQQQRMMVPGQPRPMTPHMQRQQQIIQRHITQLTPEQRQQFSNMNPREKQQYLAQRYFIIFIINLNYFL